MDSVEIKYCAYCGKEISQTAIFCERCGRSTGIASSAPPPQPQQPITVKVEHKDDTLQNCCACLVIIVLVFLFWLYSTSRLFP